MLNKLSNQQKGSFLAFVGVMFITPDSLFIRLSNIDTWSLLFYRGAIPFVVVLIGLILFYRKNFFNALFKIGLAEVPFLQSVTFSIWENEEDMNKFARKRGPHAEAIKAVREGKWFSEELYARFNIIKQIGRLDN